MNTQTKPYHGPGSRWISAVVGLISIIVGVWCLFTPDTTLVALTYVFIFGLFAEGVLELLNAFSSAGRPSMGWRIVIGIIEILLGIWICCMPMAQAALVLIYVVGFWIFFSSATGIAESCQLATFHIRGWGWLLACNIIGLLFSFLFLIGPAIGAVFTVVFAGAAFISYGIFRCSLSLTR